MPRQVDRGVVIALVARPTAVTLPVLGPPEVLDRAAAMAGPRAGKAPLGLHHLRAVPADLVTKLPAELGQGRLGRSPAPRPRPRDPLLAQPAGCGRGTGSADAARSGSGPAGPGWAPARSRPRRWPWWPTSAPDIDPDRRGGIRVARLGGSPRSRLRGAPLRAIVPEGGHRPGRPMGGGTPGAEAAQELGPVSDQVVVDLGRIDHPQSPSRGRHLLGPEPREAALRLDHDRLGHAAGPGTSDASRSTPSRSRSRCDGAPPG